MFTQTFTQPLSTDTSDWIQNIFFALREALGEAEKLETLLWQKRGPEMRHHINLGKTQLVEKNWRHTNSDPQLCIPKHLLPAILSSWVSDLHCLT